MTHILPLEIGMDNQQQEVSESARIYMRNKNMTIITTDAEPGDNLHSLFYYATNQQQYPDEHQLRTFKRECFDAILNLSQGHRLASFCKHSRIVRELKFFEKTGLANLLKRHYTTTLDIIGCAQKSTTQLSSEEDGVHFRT
jgi:hypothetical protein